MVYGVIAIVFGIIALVHPSRTLTALVWAFGVLSLAEGIVSLLSLFIGDADERFLPRWVITLYGLVSIGFGLLAISRPQAIIGAFLLLLAAWLVIAGLYRIVYAFRAGKLGDGGWVTALTGLLAIAFGITFLVFPATGLLTLTFWIAIGALLYGILQVASGLYARSRIAHA